MELAYLRVENTKTNIDRLAYGCNQQIIHVGKNQYFTDVIIPKTSAMDLIGTFLSRDDFWSANMPHLIKTTVYPYWSNGVPMVTVDFISDNLLTVLQLCGTIRLENYWLSYIDDGHRVVYYQID